MGEQGCLGAQESLPRVEFREGFLEEVALYLGFVALAGVCEGVGGKLGHSRPRNSMCKGSEG